VVKLSLVGKVINLSIGHNFDIGLRDNSNQEVEQNNLHQKLIEYHQGPDKADHC